MQNSEDYEIVPARFWRRIAAFVVDVLVLWAVGAFIGWVLYDYLIGLGPSALLIGFGVTLAYFGVMDSRLGQGRTLGKRLLHICVVDSKGHFISVPRAMLRCAVFSSPYFLSRWAVSPFDTPLLVLGFRALVVIGIGLSIVYLYIFNYRTRQSLHDLVAGSYVISSDPDEDAISLAPLWRGHLVVVVIISAFAFGLPFVFHRGMPQEVVAVMPLTRTMMTTPHVVSVAINLNRTILQGGSSIRSLNATLRLNNDSIQNPNLAYSMARFIATNDPDFAREHVVTVTLSCGFDLGIASWWLNDTFKYKAEQLLQ
jgi:uncharacterized RDD family membrane protein YckC